jgi:GTP cyclohydrolase I
MTIQRIDGHTGFIDQERLAAAVSDLIGAIHEDPGREGLKDTPKRVANMYAEVFAGLGHDPIEILTTGFEEGYDEMVVARDIPFFSMCEHHLLPFFGVAHVGYTPRGRVVGISKIARLTDVIARRPQLQERMTAQIADAIVEGVDPAGVGVVLKAEHLCMVMRGVKKPGTRIITSAHRGIFRTDSTTRLEFLALTGGETQGG